MTLDNLQNIPTMGSCRTFKAQQQQDTTVSTTTTTTTTPVKEDEDEHWDMTRDDSQFDPFEEQHFLQEDENIQDFSHDDHDNHDDNSQDGDDIGKRQEILVDALDHSWESFKLIQTEGLQILDELKQILNEEEQIKQELLKERQEYFQSKIYYSKAVYTVTHLFPGIHISADKSFKSILVCRKMKKLTELCIDSISHNIHLYSKYSHYLLDNILFYFLHLINNHIYASLSRLPSRFSKRISTSVFSSISSRDKLMLFLRFHTSLLLDDGDDDDEFRVLEKCKYPLIYYELDTHSIPLLKFLLRFKHDLEELLIKSCTFSKTLGRILSQFNHIQSLTVCDTPGFKSSFALKRISHVKQLRILHLVQIPDTISTNELEHVSNNLNNLHTFTLHDCHIESIPSNWSSFTSLKQVNLVKTKITHEESLDILRNIPFIVMEYHA